MYRCIEQCGKGAPVHGKMRHVRLRRPGWCPLRDHVPCCSYVHERAVEVLSEVHILTRRIGNLQIWRQEHLKSLHRLRSQATREANTFRLVMDGLCQLCVAPIPFAAWRLAMNVIPVERLIQDKDGHIGDSTHIDEINQVMTNPDAAQTRHEELRKHDEHPRASTNRKLQKRIVRSRLHVLTGGKSWIPTTPMLDAKTFQEETHG
mmetsp:Transcript_10256/g.23235  ORF Transcript_10256/g.23235 Transcript_10256/m.23235 type:complete len:205 (+) Transcript_10256:560-1174(+)